MVTFNILDANQRNMTGNEWDDAFIFTDGKLAQKMIRKWVLTVTEMRIKMDKKANKYYVWVDEDSRIKIANEILTKGIRRP